MSGELSFLECPVCTYPHAFEDADVTGSRPRFHCPRCTARIITARYVLRALQESYPNTRFTCRTRIFRGSGLGPDKVTLYWTGEPAECAVLKIANRNVLDHRMVLVVTRRKNTPGNR